MSSPKFTRYDFLTGIELRKELSKRFNLVAGKKSDVPLNKKNNPYQIRAFLTQDDLKKGVDPYIESPPSVLLRPEYP